MPSLRKAIRKFVCFVILVVVGYVGIYLGVSRYDTAAWDETTAKPIHFRRFSSEPVVTIFTPLIWLESQTRGQEVIPTTPI
jgi:hypothetical protein